MINHNEFVYGIAVSSSSLLFAIAVLAGFLVLAIFVSMMRIYRKAGKPSVSAIIPIWSQIVMFQIIGKPWWYIFLLLLPIANIVILIQAYILLAKKFGKGVAFGIGMFCLPMIFVPLLSFYDYVGEKNDNVQEDEPIYNPFNQNNVDQIMPTAPMTSSNELGQSLENVNPIQESVNSELQSTNIPIVENQENISTNENIITEAPIIAGPEIPVVTVEDSQNDVTAIPEVAPVLNENIQPLNQSSIEQISSNVQDINPTVQDIQSALNTNVSEPKNIAFNSTPIVEPEIKENIETLENTELVNLKVENQVLETTVIENETLSDDIEMPEIAAKTCPACGTSLAQDIKFCTSCGTQL